MSESLESSVMPGMRDTASAHALFPMSGTYLLFTSRGFLSLLSACNGPYKDFIVMEGTIEGVGI